MATYTIAAGDRAKHALTLTASQADTITFADNVSDVDIISDGAAAVYYTVDGTTPTVAGAKCYLLPAGNVVVDSIVMPGSSDTIKIISAGAPTISVQRRTRGR